MKKYENVEKTVVVKTECVELICDMCGRNAEYPENVELSFDWGGIGLAYGKVVAEYSIDGEYNEESVDLCYACANWLIEQIKAKKIQQSWVK